MYLDFVLLGDSQEFENFYLMKNLPSMLGSCSFKEYIKEKFIVLTNRVEIPKSKTLVPDSDKIISCVCEYYNVTKKELLYSKRGTENYRGENSHTDLTSRDPSFIISLSLRWVSAR